MAKANRNNITPISPQKGSLQKGRPKLFDTFVIIRPIRFYCPEFDVMTQGDDPDDAIANLKEAVRGYIKAIGIKKAFKEYRKLIRETLEVSVG